MVRNAVLLASGLIVLLAQTGWSQAAKEAPVVPPREGKREVVDIFNGKDTTGWVGHEKYWSVKDGVIIGKNTEAVPVSTYLLTERKFSDFRLTFDFKLAQSEMHSGIAMWGRVAPEKGDMFTYAGHLVMFPSGHGFWNCETTLHLYLFLCCAAHERREAVLSIAW